jgi:nucleotide-binding universal stress UspA family protein
MATFESVLAIPGSGAAHGAVAAIAVRVTRANACPLTVVDVIEPDHIAAEAMARRRALLSDTAAAAGREGIDVSEAVLHGEIAAEVIRMVLREGHDLVITGPGQPAEVLIRDCPCPVLVVKPDGFTTSVTLQGAPTE